MELHIKSLKIDLKPYYIEKVLHKNGRIHFLCDSLRNAYAISVILEGLGYLMVIRSHIDPVNNPSCRYSVLAYFPHKKIS